MKKLMTVLTSVAFSPALFGGAYDKMFENGLLRFDYSPSELSALEQQAHADLEQNLNALVAVPAEQRTFDNTALALENAYSAYWFVPKALSLLAYFHADAAVRAAAAQLGHSRRRRIEGISARPLYFPV